MHEYLQAQYEVQVSRMHDTKIRPKTFSSCTVEENTLVRKKFKKITELCGNITKLKGKSSVKIRRAMPSSTTLQLKNEKEREDRPMSRGEVEQVCSPASQFPLTLTYSPDKFLLESRRHDINWITVSQTFR